MQYLPYRGAGSRRVRRDLDLGSMVPESARCRLGGRIVADAVLGHFVITFIYYWWHRARHEVSFLWRWFHQVHHSACRIEVLTSFYKHPVEILVNGVLSSLIVYVLLGLDPVSASLTVALTGLGELFYHWNVKTPYWLGYVFQRPESHCVHHQRGHHTNNFSDLPVWDVLFGTFENPRTQPTPCGFGPPPAANELDVWQVGVDGPRSAAHRTGR
jgi:sterol desaturase/sphingolipid hydroxylase (fatty acid hydroxylase superfamily)